MDKDLADRMENLRKRLQTRSLELSHPGQDQDKAMIFMSLAQIFEALQELDRDQRRLAGQLSRQ
jgi:hypothetical protein